MRGLIMSNEYFVDVVSNASMDIFPDNTFSSFINRLPKELNLEGEWLVAVQEIIYPLSFKVTKRKVTWAISYDRYVGRTKYEFIYSENDKIKTIIDNFNKSLRTAYLNENKHLKPDEINPPMLSLVIVQEEGKPEKEKVKLKFGKLPESNRPIYFYCVDHTFMRALGFDLYSFTLKVIDANKNGYDEITAQHQPELGPKSHLVFIYSDIVHEHFVGDTYARVLRVIPLNRGQSDTLHHTTFTTPYYYPVRANRIEDIGIKICNEEGEFIKFKSGRVFLSLHFKRKETV